MCVWNSMVSARCTYHVKSLGFDRDAVIQRYSWSTFRLQQLHLLYEVFVRVQRRVIDGSTEAANTEIVTSFLNRSTLYDALVVRAQVSAADLLRDVRRPLQRRPTLRQSVASAAVLRACLHALPRRSGRTRRDHARKHTVSPKILLYRADLDEFVE